MFIKKRYFLTVLLLLGSQVAHATNPPAPLSPNKVQTSANSFEFNQSLNKYVWDRAHIPPLRYTDDGRVGVYGIQLSSTLYFNVIRPEAIIRDRATAHHMYGPDERAEFIGKWNTSLSRGHIVAELRKKDSNLRIGRLGNHIAMCDPTQFADDNTQERRNPYRCEDGGSDECYDVKLIGEVELEETLKDGTGIAEFGDRKFFSLPVTITVSNPKSATAEVSSIAINAGSNSRNVKLSQTFRAHSIFEPIITGDGRLLVYRVSNGPQHDHDFVVEGGTTKTANELDVVYSVYNEYDENNKKTEACDVTKWSTYYPITYAYHDTAHRMKERYKFAAYEMRDPSGNPYDKYKDSGASYPWVDKTATNLAFTIMNDNSNLKSNGEFRYGGTCASSFSNEYHCNEDTIYGVAINGLWTRGKTVLLDGVINPADFGLHWHKDKAVNFRFYENSTPTKVGSVRAFEGLDSRFLGDRIESAKLEDFENGFTINTTVMESIENRLNYIPEMMPQTPRDTVWKFGNSLVTTEVAFDDYINDDFLINASMTGLVAYLGEDNDKLGYQEKVVTRSRYFDGFFSNGYGSSSTTGEHIGNLSTEQRAKFTGVEREYLDTRTNGAKEPILFQNAATNTTAPAFGILESNDHLRGRIEPIAAGGVHGKGLFLQDDSRLSFELERGVTNTNPNMYVGFFLNQRDIPTSDNEWRPLLQFSDRTELYILRVGDQIRLRFRNFNAGAQTGSARLDKDINFPAHQTNRDNNWLHIGLEVLNRTDNNGSKIKAYQNGNLAGTVSYDDRKSFRPIDGSVKLGNFPGRATSGPVVGWFDEFKVKQIAEGLKLNKEEICNHARGTFIHTPKVGVMRNYADRFERQNAELNRLAGTSGKQFLCLTNYVHFANSDFSEEAKYKAFEGHTSLIQAEALGTPARALLTHRESLDVDPNSPRPDTSNNDFCLSCHNFPTGGLTAGLSINALKSSSVSFKDSPRQPVQPPRFISGKLPISLVNPPRWASVTFDSNGNIQTNYEYIDDIIADPSPPTVKKTVFIRYKSYLIPVEVESN